MFSKAKKWLEVLLRNSMFLVMGAALALVWANWDHATGGHGYHDFVHFDLATLFATDSKETHAPEAAMASGVDSHKHEHDTHGLHGAVDTHAAAGFDGTTNSHHDDAHASHGGHGHLTIHFLVNDILMAFFFALATKEVWEAFLPNGPLSSLRQAASPLMATVGGILGPAFTYLAGAAIIGQMGTVGSGWAIPCATDIAFSYLVARFIFGPGHAAISFLLLLAIADDAAGLAILAVFYPTGELAPIWLLGVVVAVGCGVAMRRNGVSNFWWYLVIPGVISWFSFYKSGIHPALGLVPVIPTLPHAAKDKGIFANEAPAKVNALTDFEHFWKNPVELILGFFALVNAGVVFSSIGSPTVLVLLGLLVGKPVGIALFVWMGTKWLRMELPEGMNLRHVTIVGSIASIGFTVALFVSTAAFPIPGAVQDAAKMGALASFLAPVLTFALAYVLGVRPAFLPDRVNRLGRSRGAQVAAG